MWTIENYLSQIRVKMDKDYVNTRARSLALTKLDEFELWLGQCARTSAPSSPITTLYSPELFVSLVKSLPDGTISRDLLGNYEFYWDDEQSNRFVVRGPHVMELEPAKQTAYIEEIEGLLDNRYYKEK